MPLAPVSRLRKSDIIWLSKNKCTHSHTYLEHYNCYLKENPRGEKIGFFDIESSNLSADYGIMLCYCIKLKGEDTILERVITKHEVNTCLDKEVVRQCIKDLEDLDHVVTFFGTYFDLTFVRTRACIHNIEFPPYGLLKHTDVWKILKRKFRLSRNRLENSCRTLLGATEKTHISPDHWLHALQGNKRSLNYIVDHCRKDVLDLEKLYDKVISFIPNSNVSI